MSKSLKRGAWITWEVQTRNRSMAKSIGIPLHELLSERSRLIRYSILLFRTSVLLWRYRGCQVFVQNPSIVLALWAVCIKPLLRLKVIVDFHNSGLFPLEGRSRLLLAISRCICRWADLSIVTNSRLAEVVADRGGRPIIVTDPLNESEFSPSSTSDFYEGDHVLFVCSWAEDEPWKEVLEAAKHTRVPVSLWVTGNYKDHLSEQAIADLPSQVRLMGFVPRGDYIRSLKSARLMIDLTTRDHCLVCGAYEAVAAGVPLLLTDMRVNREVFSKGAVYTVNEAQVIAQSIDFALENHSELKKEIQRFRFNYRKQSEVQIERLKAELHQVPTEEG